jgi:rhodanese-related sulfurtransferase
MSTIGYKALVDAAEARIRTISVEEAIDRLGSDDAVFVDLRDVRELQRDGGIPGAFHCPRGLLEFWIDPESPYHHAEFAEPKEFVFFCNLRRRRHKWKVKCTCQGPAQHESMEEIVSCSIGADFERFAERLHGCPGGR